MFQRTLAHPTRAILCGLSLDSLLPLIIKVNMTSPCTKHCLNGHSLQIKMFQTWFGRRRVLFWQRLTVLGIDLYAHQNSTSWTLQSSLKVVLKVIPFSPMKGMRQCTQTAQISYREISCQGSTWCARIFLGETKQNWLSGILRQKPGFDLTANIWVKDFTKNILSCLMKS